MTGIWAAYVCLTSCCVLCRSSSRTSFCLGACDCTGRFFFSSRRRHTRCALVTGVQTCALPICSQALRLFHPVDTIGIAELCAHLFAAMAIHHMRSEERRVGKECVSTCRSRWSPYP